MSKKSLFYEVKEKLACNSLLGATDPWSKSGWLLLSKDQLKNVLSEIDDYANSIDFKQTTSKGIWKLRVETAISQKRYSAVQTEKSLEEAIERLFVAADQDNKLFNQYSLLSGALADETKGQQTRKSIDMVIVKNDEIVEMIELKEVNKSDNPLVSAFELYFDFVLYKKIISVELQTLDGKKPIRCNDNLLLTVLCPESYYDYYKNPELIADVESLINSHLNDHFYGVSFRYMQFSNTLIDKIKTYVHISDKLSQSLPPEHKKAIGDIFNARRNVT